MPSSPPRFFLACPLSAAEHRQLISTIPFDSIFDAVAGSSSSGGLGWLSLGRLLKLVRFMKLAKVLDKLEVEGRISPSSASLVKLTVAVGFIGHSLACR